MQMGKVPTAFPPAQAPEQPAASTEWVLKRRPDGTHYVARRPIRSRTKRVPIDEDDAAGHRSSRSGRRKRRARHVGDAGSAPTAPAPITTRRSNQRPAHDGVRSISGGGGGGGDGTAPTKLLLGRDSNSNLLLPSHRNATQSSVSVKKSVHTWGCE